MSPMLNTLSYYAKSCMSILESGGHVLIAIVNHFAPKCLLSSQKTHSKSVHFVKKYSWTIPRNPGIIILYFCMYESSLSYFSSDS